MTDCSSFNCECKSQTCLGDLSVLGADTRKWVPIQGKMQGVVAAVEEPIHNSACMNNYSYDRHVLCLKHSFKLAANTSKEGQSFYGHSLFTKF